jgi:disulfide oxidoreductase YuzD
LRHGQDVQVDYVDLADPAAQAEFSELMAVIEERNLPYPLVAVNDHLRLAGSAQYYQVLPLVEDLLQVRNTEATA